MQLILLQIAIDSERAVGVQSGGMDQSASVLSTRGSLLHISFFPKLHATPVPLPTGSSQPCFVIANSMVVSYVLTRIYEMYADCCLQEQAGESANRGVTCMLTASIGYKQDSLQPESSRMPRRRLPFSTNAECLNGILCNSQTSH